MHVDLLAYPTLNMTAARSLGYTLPPDTCTDAEMVIEIAGRNCYQSWDRPNPATATNAGYMTNIIRQQHFSVMEHAQFVFAVRHVSRAFSHELVRHRHLQFSQVSQRYVDESDGDFILPLEIARSATEKESAAMWTAHDESLRLYTSLVDTLVHAGVPRKRARQAARYVLPNGHATTLIVSGNIRAWREVIAKRLHCTETGEPVADLEFFHFGQWILHLLHRAAPNTVTDLWENYVRWLTDTSAPDNRLIVPSPFLNGTVGP